MPKTAASKRRKTAERANDLSRGANMRSAEDIAGSYTGVDASDAYAVPEQDADDL